jgi:hypothetical protein
MQAELSARTQEPLGTFSPPQAAGHHKRSRAAESPAESPLQHVGGDEQGNRRKLHKVSRACDLCKAKKVRCNGTQPCGACVKRDVLCTYTASYSRGRPPTPPPGPTSVVSASASSPESLGMAKGRMATTTMRTLQASVEPVADADNHIRIPVPRGESPANANGIDTSGPSRASPELDAAEIEGQYSDPTSGLTFLHRAYRRFSSHRRQGVAPFVRGVIGAEDQHLELMSAGD